MIYICFQFIHQKSNHATKKKRVENVTGKHSWASLLRGNPIIWNSRILKCFLCFLIPKMMIFKLNFNQVCLNHGELFRIRDFQRLLGVGGGGGIGETNHIRKQKQQQQKKTARRGRTKLCSSGVVQLLWEKIRFRSYDLP